MALSQDLVSANYHILYDQGILDSLGQLSVRDPENSLMYLLSKNIAPVMVTTADILRFDLTGHVQASEAPAVYLERLIHAAIYRLGPDVHAVVHSHVASVLPFGVVAEPLCPVCRMSGFIGSGVPISDIRDHAGEASDLLIRRMDLGLCLALTLGEHCLVLMRGRGMTIGGGICRKRCFAPFIRTLTPESNWQPGNSVLRSASMKPKRRRQRQRLWARSSGLGTSGPSAHGLLLQPLAAILRLPGHADAIGFVR